MSQKIEAFKEFIKEHPSLKTVINKRQKSWQDLFEEWSLLGPEKMWKSYTEGDEEVKESSSTKTAIPVPKEMAQLGDILKTCMNYVKKINPDNISKTVTNVQKLMALVAGIGAANTVKAAKGNKLTGDPLFDKKFDDWY